MALLAAGDTVGGRYVVKRHLGGGGFASVYVVSDGDVERALKVMRADLADEVKDAAKREQLRESLRRRFLREGRLAESVRSDHVVRVLASGVDEKIALPYLVMELLDGATLDEVVERHGAVPLSLASLVLSHVAHALGEAAKANIVHRDVKPQNLYVCESRTHGLPFVVKVIDFGIAKVLADGGATTLHAFSLGWSPPEQTSDEAPISPATDVWPFGLLAFWLLTGRPYWKASETAQSALMREIHVDPLAPATERARASGVELPAWFDAWFAKCVVREPERRFETARAACDALRKHASAAPTDAEVERFVACIKGAPPPVVVVPTIADTAPATTSGSTGTIAAAPLPSAPDVEPHDAHGGAPAALEPPRRPPRGIAAYVVLGGLCTAGVVGLFGGFSECGAKPTPTDAVPTETASTTHTPTPTPEAPAPSDGKLEITDLVVGTGAEARAGDRVKVHYVGTLPDGKEFDSSRKHGRPFEFDLGKGRVIKGWDQGVAGMRVGGKRRLSIPPSLAYGARGFPPVIPANATLVFEVELIDVR